MNHYVFSSHVLDLLVASQSKLVIAWGAFIRHGAFNRVNTVNDRMAIVHIKWGGFRQIIVGLTGGRATAGRLFVCPAGIGSWILCLFPPSSVYLRSTKYLYLSSLSKGRGFTTCKTLKRCSPDWSFAF